MPSATTPEQATITRRRVCLVPFQRIARAFSARNMVDKKPRDAFPIGRKHPFSQRRKSANALYVDPHDGTMVLLEGQEAQERVDAAHHNVYNMHTTGRAWLELVVCCDRSRGALV